MDLQSDIVSYFLLQGAGYDNVAYKAVHPYNEERTDPNNTKSESSDESKIKPLPYYSLFRYSTTCEKLLILMSVLFSIVSGFANPLLSVFLGNVTNLMVNYNLSREQLATNRSIIANISGAEFVTDDEFKEGVIKFCWYMAAIGAMLLITIAVTIWVMNYTAERQTRRIRNMYMKAMLRQEISWFDTHQSGEFSSKVGENLQKLQMGMGEKIALTMYFFSSFIISIIIAFIVGWKLTLVMLSVSPLLSISTGVLSKVQAEFASKELVIYGKAAAIAEEVLGAIRTVVAFGGEKKEIKRYSEKLLDAKKSGIKRGIISAVGLSMFNLFIFVVYALSFWYGVKLVIESRVSGSNEYTAGSMLNVFMNVMFGSMFIGQIAPFMEVFSTAKAAAASVFQIIENEPLIDSFSSEGKTLSALKGNIKFDNVSFQYPSRPSVPVRGNTELRICKRLCKDDLRDTHCKDDKQCKVLTFVSKNVRTSNLLECDCRNNYCSTTICQIKVYKDKHTGKLYTIECDCNKKKYPPKVISDPARVRKLIQKYACTRTCDPKTTKCLQSSCIVTRFYWVKGELYQRECYCDKEKYSGIIWYHNEF